MGTTVTLENVVAGKEKYDGLRANQRILIELLPLVKQYEENILAVGEATAYLTEKDNIQSIAGQIQRVAKQRGLGEWDRAYKDLRNNILNLLISALSTAKKVGFYEAFRWAVNNQFRLACVYVEMEKVTIRENGADQERVVAVYAYKVFKSHPPKYQNQAHYFSHVSNSKCQVKMQTRMSQYWDSLVMHLEHQDLENELQRRQKIEDRLSRY